MITKPMLAVAVKDIAALKYPVLCTPKLDGIRCLIVNGKAVTRKFKPVPNHYIRKQLETLPDGLDGEIMVPGKTFNEIQSLVMSEDGEPEFEYYVFDYVQDLKVPYFYRVSTPWPKLPDFVVPVMPVTVYNSEALSIMEEMLIKSGFEGVMIRSPEGPYKCGRSTLKEGYLLKLKRFADSEAEVLAFVEKMHNENEATKDALGHTKRSKKKANLTPADTLGTMVVRDVKSGVQFEIGTGFNDELRKEIWLNPEKYIGKLVTYKYQSFGVKNKPRCPVFKGFRDERDMS